MGKRKSNNTPGGPIIIRPQPGKQELFLRSPADICIYGGAAGGGKTYALLLECLRNINNQHFEAVIFRQSRPQILSAGGLFATSQEIYPYLGASSVLTPNVQWRFPSGAKVTFAHMFYEKEKYNWQGSQIPLLMFDELVHFTESQFFYMFSRNRSTCGVKPYIRATCNPDGESWVARFIDWWIDPETGYADESRCGKIRYFVRKNNIIHWADTAQELYETFGLYTPEDMADVKSVPFISHRCCQMGPGLGLGSHRPRRGRRAGWAAPGHAPDPPGRRQRLHRRRSAGQAEQRAHLCGRCHQCPGERR